MHPKPVEALAAKRRYQRGVHIDYPLGVELHKVLAEDAHEAREDYKLYAVLFQGFEYIGFKLLLAAPALLTNAGRYACILGALEGVGARAARYDERYLAAVKRSAALRVNERLQIRAAARYEHGDGDPAHMSTTLSADLIILPRI